MPYNSRNPGDSGQQAAHQYPVSRSLALLVLAALVALWALRHVFGSVTVAAGTK